MAEQPRPTDVNYFQKYAERVLANGWPMVLLNHASKKPMQNGWQKQELTRAHVRSIIASGKKRGIGIKCGNIIGLDDDYEEGGAVTKEFLEAMQELKDHYFPEALLRRGRPSRPPLRVVRLADGETFRSLNVDKFQIIGVGRQFVAYNIHPDTNKPYAWLKAGDGTPASTELSDVPTYTRKTIQDFINAVILMEESFGLAPDSAADTLRRIKSGDLTRPKNLTAEQRMVERACEYIENDKRWGWEDWNNNIMMPLWNASEGEDWGLELAKQLSAQSDLYDEDTTEERWEQIGKSPPALLGWPRLNWLARQGGMPFLGPRDWDDFKLILNQDAFYNARIEQWMSDKMFNNLFNEQKTKGKTPLQTFIQSRPDQCYDEMIWDPKLQSGDTMRGNKKAWNTWKDPDWFGEEGDGNVKPWLWVVRNVYAEEWKLAIKRMAYDVQYPNHRPQWHLMATGDNGIGKSDSIMPITRWAERFNLLSTVRNETLKSTFNSFISRKKIIVVNEPGGITDRLFNEMKDMLAGNEKNISVEEKYKNPRDEAIVASFYFGGNKQNAISITDTERRIYPVHSHAKTPTPENGMDDAVRRHRWIEKNWQKVVWYLRNRVKVDVAFGQSFPGINKYQRNIAAVTAPLHMRLAKFINETLNGHLLFTIRGLHEHLVNGEEKDMGVSLDEISYPMLLRALHQMGAVQCYNGRPVRVDNTGQKRLWSFDLTLENENPSSLRNLWEFVGLPEEVEGTS